ncbi:MAG: hemerythrin domain-containing protein [Pseudomonadota bacterium]
MRPSATHPGTRVIHEEHDRMWAVLQGMRHFVRATAGGAKPPACKVFRAMLLYIVDYPEKLHHPKEEQLFALLRQRTGSVDDEIAQLGAQHEAGEAMVRELEHMLTQYELDREAGFAPFARAVEDYCAFSFEHMRLEEDIVLPAADRYLTEQDWNKVDRWFAANRDPLAGTAYKEGFDRLFSLIVNITPAPIGLASPT